MSEQEKKWQWIYDLLNAETKPPPKKNEIIFMASIKPRLDYAIWGILENKTNAKPHLNIRSLKTAIEEEWNNICKEFISKACKSFRRRFYTIEKDVSHIEWIYCFVSIFIFSNYFLKSKLIWFYNNIVYQYTRIFLSLHLHPIYIYIYIYIYISGLDFGIRQPTRVDVPLKTTKLNQISK